MDIIEAIYKRQSIRSFKDREVSQETDLVISKKEPFKSKYYERVRICNIA